MCPSVMSVLQVQEEYESAIAATAGLAKANWMNSSLKQQVLA